ncbi:hypothetical protein ACFR9U_20215 [Halorientalis brevis]|uniref:DUF2798 domain-containing protein n=1 Tax=Halorientalis brevis TaxID=1126241 RepID=A0ABD6CJ46_9EURY|nr:hypothetical protein [Halorientalis brevis]
MGVIHALQVVIQLFTTFGFGADAPWQSPAMELLMVGMKWAGAFVIAMPLALFVVPWITERLRSHTE